MSHLELGAVHLQQLLAVDVVGRELWDILLHVEAPEPLTHLLRAPRRHQTQRLISMLAERERDRGKERERRGEKERGKREIEGERQRETERERERERIYF